MSSLYLAPPSMLSIYRDFQILLLRKRKFAYIVRLLSEFRGIVSLNFTFAIKIFQPALN